jgi:hypothetical protein
VQPEAVRDSKRAMQLAKAALSGNGRFVRTAVSQPLPGATFYWARVVGGRVVK